MPANCTPAPRENADRQPDNPSKATHSAQRHAQEVNSATAGSCKAPRRRARPRTEQARIAAPRRAARRFSMHARPRTHNRTNSANGSARSCHPPLAPLAEFSSPPRAGGAPCQPGVRGWLAGNCRAEYLALTCCAKLDCRLLDVEVAQRAVRAHPLHIRLNLPGRIKERGRGEIRGAPALLCCCGRRRQARHGHPRLRQPPAKEPPGKHGGAGGGCNP